ncbi:MAG TPA: AAA family ATPase [Ktedonobacteraceae bacterium]|nr:AAA family ATPase [Ktedonobacteraceae bacterium]
MQNVNTTMTSMQEQDYFTPATREAIHIAQREAVRMNAPEVTPEHLFPGVLAQDGDGVTEVFSTLRLDQAILRKQAATIFPSHGDTGEGDEKQIPLSSEAQTCLEWARCFATHLHVSSVQLEHVLLGSIRHQRLQPLLALFLVNAGGIFPSYVTDRSGLAYTVTMDQFIASRIRRRRVASFNNGVFSSFVRPTSIFSDIVGLHGIKQELQEVIDFLRNPQLVQQDVRSYLYGLLLIGPAGNSRTLIGQAIAGEATVPLLSLSLPALFAMVSSSNGNYTEYFGDVHSSHEMGRAEQETMAQHGRHMIHDLFEQGKKVSPCVICLDELDALARPEMREVCESWQSQLRIEMDGCDIHPAMAIMATVSQREQIEQLPLLPGCFAHTATLDETGELKDTLP